MAKCPKFLVWMFNIVLKRRRGRGKEVFRLLCDFPMPYTLFDWYLLVLYIQIYPIPGREDGEESSAGGM